MAGFNPLDLLQQAVAATNQSNVELEQGAADLGMVNQQILGLLTKSQTEMAGAVQDAQKVAGQKAAIDYARNSQMEKIQRLYRLDPEQVNYAVAQDMAAYEKTRDARVATRAEYDNLNSKDFLTNPLGWIVAQTKLPQVAAQNNALADQEDEALQDIRVRQELFGATKNTVVANTADAIQANQLDEAAVKARAGMADLDQQTAKNLALVSAGKLQQIQLADKIGDNKRSTIGLAISALGADEARKARLEAKEGQTEYRELQRLMLKEKLDEIKGRQEEKDRFNERFKIISDSLGHSVPMTTDRLKTLPQKEQSAWIDAAQSSGYGSGLGDAVLFFQQKQNLRSTENSSLQGVANKIDGAAKVLAPNILGGMRAMDPTGKTKITEEQIRDATYKAYKDSVVASMASDEKVGDDLSSPKWDKTYNVYVAPFTSFNKAIETQPGLAPLKNNAVKQQLDILAAAGTVRGDNLTSDQQQQVFSAIQNKVEKKEMTSAQAAAEISTFMKYASGFNLGINKYSLFGLPDQQKYMYTLPGAKDKVDLLNPGAVENALMRNIKDKYAAEYTQLGVFRNSPGWAIR